MGLSDLHSNRCLSNGTAQTGPGAANAHNSRPQQREAQFTSQPSHHYSIGKTVLYTQKVGQSLIKLSSSTGADLGFIKGGGLTQGTNLLGRGV